MPNFGSKTAVKICVLALCTIFAVVGGAQALANRQAESSDATMRTLPENLAQQTHNEPGFQITFRFIKPPLDTISDFWQVPSIASSSQPALSIEEIGDDHICFGEDAGQSFVTTCTPFSNIAAVNYSSSS